MDSVQATQWDFALKNHFGNVGREVSIVGISSAAASN